jgi:rubrerythrin
MDKREFESIMDMAIAGEVEAYQFYLDVANRVADASLKKIFGDFAQEEKGHEAMLGNIKEKEIQNFSFASGPDYKVSEAVDLPKLSLEMKPVDAITLAMKKEEAAMKMYNELAAATSDPEKQKIFTSLAKMEEGHKAKMENLYTQTAFPEVW